VGSVGWPACFSGRLRSRLAKETLGEAGACATGADAVTRSDTQCGLSPIPRVARGKIGAIWKRGREMEEGG